jgi:NAD(P)-dependent dehydrogenase (short-subunit alcohol dehydrogenase family)
MADSLLREQDYSEPFKSLSLAGKVLLVVGGARNTGERIARLGAARGAKIVIGDILDNEGEAVAQTIRDAGGEAYFKHCDVKNEPECAALVAFTVEKFGELNLAANNQGYFQFLTKTENYPSDEFDLHMKTNAYGTFYLLKYETAQMVKQGKGGAITNTSSEVGLLGQPDMTGYSTSKHAVLGMTKTAADEYGPQNIRVNAICPGPIASLKMDENWHKMGDGYLKAMHDRVPLNRVSDPIEQAEVVLFTLSDAASYISGAIWATDGGKNTAH